MLHSEKLIHSFWVSNGNVSLKVRENTPVLLVSHVSDLEKHFDIKGLVGIHKINFLAIWLCSSFLFIVFHFSCFVFDWDTVNIRKHHLRDVLKEVLQKYINHLKLRKTSSESFKAILGEIHFTKICVIYISSLKWFPGCVFAVFLLFFWTDPSGCFRLSQ